MAIAIPEAAEAVTAGEAAVSRAGAASAARPGKVIRAQKVQDVTYSARTEAPRSPQKPAARTGRVQPAVQPGGGRKGGRRPRGGGGGRAGQYQPVILAEFLVAVLVVSLPPLASGGDPTAKAKGSPSPYSTDTLKQLIAVGFVYFILALLSGSRKIGRFTGWFGGLVLLGIGLLQVADGDLAALFKIFGPGTGAPAALLAPGEAAGIGQAAQGALGFTPAAGQPVPPGGQFGTGQDVTGIFPVIQPPPGGTGVTTTTGNDAGANLASQAIGGAV